MLLAPALHRGGDAQGFAVFGHRAARNIDAVALQLLHDLIVGQDGLGRFRLNQLANAMAHRFGGMRLPSAAAEAMAEVKKYLSSNTPRGVATYLFEVTRLTVDFVHGNGVRHRFQVERFQVLHAVAQEAVLLAHDFLGHAQNRARALIEALHQPIGVLQAFDQVVPSPSAIRSSSRRPRNSCG